MTILDRFLGHDAWTTRQLMLRCHDLTDQQLDQQFDIGNRSLRETFVHMIECMEIHLDRMEGRQDRNLPEDYSLNALLMRGSLIYKDLSAFACRIDQENLADSTWRGGSGNLRTYGAGIVHLITHNMHHRAQALYILEKLGVADVIEGDALGWESIARGWGWEDGGSYGTPVAG